MPVGAPAVLEFHTVDDHRHPIIGAGQSLDLRLPQERRGIGELERNLFAPKDPHHGGL